MPDRRLYRAVLAAALSGGLLAGAGVSAAGSASGAAARPSAAAAPAAMTTPRWQEGQTYGPWRLVYHGYGTVAAGRDHVSLVPRSVTSPDMTSASLVASVATFRDLRLTARMRTDRQVRRGSAPNPWEVAWLLWHHTDDEHFYALALKPNGWELSKEDPAYPGAQRYLATGSSPKYPIGRTYTASVTQVGNRIRVSVDGRHLATFTDRERPYRSGSVALYTEDAGVTFSQVRVDGKRLPWR